MKELKNMSIEQVVETQAHLEKIQGQFRRWGIKSDSLKRMQCAVNRRIRSLQAKEAGGETVVYPAPHE